MIRATQVEGVTFV
uniref:Uncharacterized protein n=1 Tax=Arundo donax TaxID=35708 RepID=A0A0A9TSL4_ARUDO